MAIAKPGPLIAALSGKLGAVVFTNATKVPCIATHPRKRNQQSENQLIVRARFQFLSTTWRGLSPAKKTAWATATYYTQRTNRLGVPRQQTNFQLFMSVNLQRLEQGLDYSELPPPNLTPVDYLEEWVVANYLGIKVKIWCPLTSIPDTPVLKFRYMRTLSEIPASPPKVYSPYFYVPITPGAFVYGLETYYAPITGFGQINEFVYFDVSYTADGWRPGPETRLSYRLTNAIPP